MPGGKKLKRKRPPLAPKSAGAPGIYNAEEHPAAARLLTANGKTKADIAESFGINRDTISYWCKHHPEFSAAIELGREDATDRVERAIFERATGYTFPSEKIVVVSGGQGTGSSVERVPITEHCPPDPTAAKFWLGNRRPKEWRERSEVTIEAGASVAKLLEEADARAAAH